MEYVAKSNDCVTRSFIFPNSKINDLKLKVKAMTADAVQPTYVEVVNWLLYKCVLAAATKNSGSFTPTAAAMMTNIRGRMIQPLPENSIGNFCVTMQIPTNNESELKKPKMQFKGVRNIKTVFGSILNFSSQALEEHQRKFDGANVCSSFCGFPLYESDFGWGTPVKATLAGRSRKNSFVLMDAPSGDSIEALVCLEKEHMNIIQSDPELLAFC